MAETRSYRIVPARSRLWADVRATLQHIRVDAGSIDGEFELPMDQGRIAPGRVENSRIRVAAKHLDGGNRLFNRDLHRTLESRKYPEVRGRIVEILAGATPDELLVRGELRLHGGTSNVEGRVKVDYPDDDHIHFAGSSSFEIEKHGLQPRRLLVLTVDNEVSFHGDIIAEAVR